MVMGSLLGILKMFWNQMVVMDISAYTKCTEYTKNQLIIYFRRVNFTVCELYLKVVIKN